MIEFYTAGTPNGRKVAIMLEESGLPYELRKVNLGAGEQHRPEFLKISPNHKIPAIVDRDGPDGEPLSLFESGAILAYLAEKSGKLLARDTRGRHETNQWLMFQMAGIGPMLGQNWWFRKSAPETVPLAVGRYLGETRRLYGVMDRRLGEAPYLAGDYSIADIAVFPWVTGDWQGVDRGEFPNLARWHDAVAMRPAVQAGMKIPA